MPCIRSARAWPGKVPPISDRVARYRADYLSRRESVHRKQTYICYETYRRLARILPLLSEGMTVPAFLDNVLNAHLKQYEEELDEMSVLEPEIHFDYGTAFFLSGFRLRFVAFPTGWTG